MTQEEWKELRDKLIIARDSCFEKFEVDGLVILSHAIRFCFFLSKMERNMNQNDPRSQSNSTVAR